MPAHTLHLWALSTGKRQTHTDDTKWADCRRDDWRLFTGTKAQVRAKVGDGVRTRPSWSCTAGKFLKLTQHQQDNESLLSVKNCSDVVFQWQQQNAPPITSSDPGKAADCVIHQGRTEGGVCVRVCWNWQQGVGTTVCVCVCVFLVGHMYVSCSSLASKRHVRPPK